MNAWQAVASALKAEKTEFVFGLPGGDLFFDSLLDIPEIKAVQVREETAGPFMAMGYARVSGKPGICYAPSGPGVAHLVPGILEAFSACLPVIAIGCSSKRANAGMGAFQEVDQTGLMKPITKWCERVTEPQRIFWVMRRAFSYALNGQPGPVYIDIPKDVGLQEVRSGSYLPAEYPLKTSADPRRLEQAAHLLRKAKRPVIVAGGGAVSARAFAEVRRFAERMHIPVLTTPCGRGILPEDHSLAFGLVGLYFSELGQKIYREADLLINLGSRNEDFQSGEQKFFPRRAKYIQIDIAPEEIGRNWAPDTAVVGDIQLVLRQWLDQMEEEPSEKRRVDPRMAKILRAKKFFEAQVKAECETDEIPIKTKRVIKELNDIFGPHTILVNENGSQDLWSYQWPFYKVLEENSCVAPGEQTCMGGGCAAAIGAKLASPEKNVVCPTGDGAFQMFMKELATASQYQAAVAYIVLNNFGLGWIKYHQRNLGDRYIATDFKVQPDFVKIAEANQCFGERAEKPEDIRPVLERALSVTQKGTPAVVEFLVDGWDFSPGFKNFYKRLSGKSPAQKKKG
ncbi:MAG: thiamine pyrophosphate protein central region [Deltaproteobacteria bacterium]|nr:thiamine pyrophosphate protein central region [Deltaproteobacteria bacterium]